MCFIIRLPDNVLYSEEPQLVYWSEQGKHWRLDGFTDISFDEGKNIYITFLQNVKVYFENWSVVQFCQNYPINLKKIKNSFFSLSRKLSKLS